MRGKTIEDVFALRNVENIFRVLRRKFRKTINPMPYFFEEMSLSRCLGYTYTDNLFFQYGPGQYRNLQENEDFCLFFSDELSIKLAMKEIWCVDGTFDVVPRPFYQLYSISYIENNHVVPCIFALLKRKTQETYTRLFETVLQLIGNCSPRVIKTDFERAAINALQIAFPQTHISGCLFHLNQSIIRKIQHLGLMALYKTDSNVRLFTKSLAALCFVGIDYVADGFDALRNHDDFPVALIPIYNYFFETYINEETRLFTVEMWHCRFLVENDIPKTNNAIEGWHSIFKRSFGSCHSSLFNLVYRLKNEENAARLKSYQIELGMSIPRKRRYVLMEARLNSFMSENRNSGNIDFIFQLTNLLFYQ